MPSAPFMEEGTESWDDPGKGEGNKKQSLVDLTAKSGWRLDHNVSQDRDEDREARDRGKEQVMGKRHVKFGGVADASEHEGLNESNASSSSCGEKVKAILSSECVKGRKKAMSPGLAGGTGKRGTIHDRPEDHGSARLDESVRKAMEGRLGRRETCVVNAAIMANSWGGPKRFNKPIVVDIDLPVWQDWMGDVGDAR